MNVFARAAERRRQRRVARLSTTALRAQAAGHPAAFGALEPLFRGPHALEQAELAVCGLARVITRTLPPADVNISFVAANPLTGEGRVVEPEQAPPILVAWTRMIGALVRRDAATVAGVWEGFVAGDLERARELVRFALVAAGTFAAIIPCTCGQCGGPR